MSWLFAALAFGLLIAFHEFGHMWVAKRMGMRVERFSIGFGPTILTWKRGETEYALSAIPLGGYVKVAGMAPEDDIDPNDPASYANKPAWRRALVIGAGPFFNYLLAFLIGVPLLMFANSRPAYETTRIGNVGEGTPAAIAGLKTGDLIKRVGAIEVSAWEPMRTAINDTAKTAEGKAFPLLVERDGKPLELQLAPKLVGEGRYQIGVTPGEVLEPGLPLPTAIVDAANNLWLQSTSTVSLLANMITGRQKAELSGPLGILSHTAEQAKKGFSSFIQTVWLLSVAIGIFNILPIPALDGGRLVFIALEAISRRRINQRVEGMIHFAGMIALVALMLFVTYGDMMKKIKPS